MTHQRDAHSGGPTTNEASTVGGDAIIPGLKSVTVPYDERFARTFEAFWGPMTGEELQMPPDGYGRCRVCYGPGQMSATRRSVPGGFNVYWFECRDSDCPGHFLDEVDADAGGDMLSTMWVDSTSYWFPGAKHDATCLPCGGTGSTSTSSTTGAATCTDCGGQGYQRTTEWTRCFTCKGRVGSHQGSCLMCRGRQRLMGRLSPCYTCNESGWYETQGGERKLCEECRGLRVVAGRWSLCSLCDGAGWYSSSNGKDVDCSVCNGVGSRTGVWSPCFKCDATGGAVRNDSDSICDRCSGEGSVRGIYTMCYMCRGPGWYENTKGKRVACGACSRTGMLEGLHCPCFKCETTGYTDGNERCNVCHGIGSVKGLWTRCFRCEGGGSYKTQSGEAKACHHCISMGICPGAPYLRCHCPGNGDEGCQDCWGAGMVYQGHGRMYLHPSDYFEDCDLQHPGLRRRF